jgi:hypothetical protein
MDEQEPVAHVYRIEANGRPCVAWDNASEIKVGAKLYAAPPKQWVGLTDEELKPLCDENPIMFGAYTVDFIQAIEAKLKEKNT